MEWKIWLGSSNLWTQPDDVTSEIVASACTDENLRIIAAPGWLGVKIMQANCEVVPWGENSRGGRYNLTIEIEPYDFNTEMDNYMEALLWNCAKFKYIAMDGGYLLPNLEEEIEFEPQDDSTKYPYRFVTEGSMIALDNKSINISPEHINEEGVKVITITCSKINPVFKV